MLTQLFLSWEKLSCAASDWKKWIPHFLCVKKWIPHFAVRDPHFHVAKSGFAFLHFAEGMSILFEKVDSTFLVREKVDSTFLVREKVDSTFFVSEKVDSTFCGLWMSVCNFLVLENVARLGTTRLGLDRSRLALRLSNGRRDMLWR